MRNSITIIFCTLIITLTFSISAIAGGNGQGKSGNDSKGPISTVDISINPAPIPQGSILLSQPLAVISGLKYKQHLYVNFTGGYRATATTSIGGHVYADSNGQVNFDFDLMRSSREAQLDLALIGTSGNLKVWNVKKNGDWEELTTVDVAFLPTPGSCSITPEAARPGVTRELSGDAAPNEKLKAIWYDTINCDCWWLGCNSCENIKREAEFSADSSGHFSAIITPSSQSGGFCEKPVTIINSQTEEVIAASRFSLCER